ncbi:MAG TPA: DUF1552 domain-containing protein [Polyangiaceae bacterium]|nr:DUF1552 domain-containing protein [Polyangiaceae bacterium]
MKGLVHGGVSRRLFLRGAGGALLALPFLQSLLPKSAGAQAATAPKRFIVFKSFSTQLIKQWYPTFQGNGYALKNSKYNDSRGDGSTLLTQKLAGGPYTWAPLSDLKTDKGISGILGAKLNPFLDKLTLIRGLDFLPSVNHNFGGLLGNFASCTKATPCDADSLGAVPTIDQVLAYSPKFYQSTPGLRSLHVSQGVGDAMSYSDGGKAGGAVEQLKTRTNPRDVFNDLFAGVMDSGTPAPSGPDPDALLVDKVVEQYRALKASSRLSADDRAKLEAHIGLLAEVEAKLSSTTKLSCTKPAEPGSLDNNSGTDPSDIQKKWDLFLDLVVAAIACDRTRVITIGVHKALGPGPDPADTKLIGHYHSEDASGGTWHGLAHDFGNENSRRMLAGINNWIAQELFAKLLAKLDVAENGDQTMLDNSLVYWGNELGFNHIAYSVPCLLAGGAGGFIKTGRYLDYIDWDGKAYFSQEDGNVIKGIPHNRFLVTALQAMGLSPADYERGGQPGYGSTSTNGRDGNAWPINYDLASIGQILPGIQG